MGARTLVRRWRGDDDDCMEPSITHTCPYCELVFSYHNEVKDHIVHDHPEHAAVVDSIEPREMPHS
jgi:5-methylcytosine-specific restriction endonuclease McrA